MSLIHGLRQIGIDIVKMDYVPNAIYIYLNMGTSQTLIVNATVQVNETSDLTINADRATTV